MKSIETQQYANVGAWWILFAGFREDPGRALAEVIACAVIFGMLLAALYLKEILIWIQGVLG
jgi:hypothetical protein